MSIVHLRLLSSDQFIEFLEEMPDFIKATELKDYMHLTTDKLNIDDCISVAKRFIGHKDFYFSSMADLPMTLFDIKNVFICKYILDSIYTKYYKDILPFNKMDYCYKKIIQLFTSCKLQFPTISFFELVEKVVEHIIVDPFSILDLKDNNLI